MSPARISIWSNMADGLEAEEMVKFLTGHGFEYSELSIEHSTKLAERSHDDWKKFRRFADSEGLKFRQGHLRNGIDIASADAAKRAEAIEVLKRWLELYAILGITAGVVHPGGWESHYFGADPIQVAECRADSLRQLEKFTLNMPVTVCLENLADTAPDADALLDMIKLSGADKIGVCLDTGHLNLSTRNPGNFIRDCGSKLLALHLNDNSGLHQTNTHEQGFWYPDDLHLFPICRQEAVDWAEVSAALKEINYTGLFNFETPGEMRGSPLEQRAVRLDYALALGNCLFNS